MKELQDFQWDFDKKYFPEVLNIDREDWLVFISNALCGEAGEFANIVKKIARNRLFKKNIEGATLENYKEKLAEEITDVLIYCIIVGNILEIDLKEEFYKKQKKNEAKFRD